MSTSRKPHRFSTAVTAAVLLFSAIIVATAVALRETETAPAPGDTGADRQASVETRPPVAPERNAGDAPPVAEPSTPASPVAPRPERQGPGLTILAQVTSTDDQPLSGATVFVFGQMDRQARTDETGRCELWLDLASRKKAYAVKIEKSGFLPRSVILSDELEGHETWPLKVELEAVGAAAPVRGYLFSAEGPVAGETVVLYATATHTHYRATSGDDGYFDLGEVATGSYQVRVRPQGGYKDYADSSLHVAASGLDLDLELQRIERSGLLQGRLVTPEGAVASGVRLYLRSRKALAQVVAVAPDVAGGFVLEGLATGEVLLESRGFPRQVVRGLKTGSSDAPEEITVVVDTGSAALEGLVEDEDGRPVAGARVELHWSRTDGEVESSSARQATTDTAGRFRFEGFAAVEHEILIQRPGYPPARRTVTTGEEHVAIRLSRAS